ncbi:MAG TPA: BON domain-containing protein [Candidatus Binatus sp.]|nr:BON domain-containing protein [Candidatus Binatus sp.]
MKNTFLFVASLAVAMSVGCARKADDAKLSSDIQSKFSQDSGLSSKQLTVDTKDGVVTLGGTVDNAAQRDAASRQAASVAGVREVVNNLQVGNAPAASGVAASVPAGATRALSAAPADKPRPALKRKNGKAPDSEPADVAGNSAEASNGNDSNANQMSGENQPAPDPAGQAPPDLPPPPSTTAAAGKRMIIDQGTQVTVRLIDPIDSEKNQAGDTFHATLNAALTSDGEEAVPAGVELTGHLVDVKSASKFAGQSVVVLQLDRLSYGGKTYGLETDQYRKEGKSRGKNTAEKVGGGAILGGIIGAIAGGGKGAVIGTAAGAGAGGAAQAASKSQQIKLASETVLNFVLQAPIEVVKAPAEANRPKLGDAQ